MVPKAEEPEPESTKALDGEWEQRHPQNPTVLRAAIEIVKRKKADAIEKEEYSAAARLHQKLQELEAQLQGGEGRNAACEDATADVGTGAAKSGAVRPSSTHGRHSSMRPRSLLATPNPFRTVELLRQSGYSRFQAYALLGLLYVAVFALEMLLVYAGWQFIGHAPGDGSAEDAGEVFDEF
mmetsp:Transcript_98837/g.275088  ORF Transcript_98837/g.275088 Transcript_98837/m.275088 type:complete len:181 (-) Transcript_98837:143-685(-)|eukprot:CAMPEP_0179120296 /NCGR_PEP_ID=MMETSP0796-20121207/56671_1 /TAXON_ID=73915 /ORGANISM="Pyrodinium bahamense, Strain pbaha01" /LENGTH=180 /DNA_ID=CAMNT_0020818831 /DNA_START=31 /DNA_END=573 /DNA_ORIENTATION=+